METLIIVYFGVFGLIVGSFLNVVIYRLPIGLSLVKPDSHCPVCKNFIKWYDNIPLLSYIILKGKCRNCGCKISPSYFLVELFCSVVFVYIYLTYGLFPMTAINIFFFSCLITIFFIDLEHKIIPDSFIIIILFLGIMALFIDSFYEISTLTWYDRLIGFGVSGGSFLLISVLGKRILKRDALGDGDTKLVAVCGFLIGWQLILFGIFLGALIACLVELPQIILKKKGRENEIPFGPYLSMGIFIAMLFGSQLLTWYFSLFSI
jgi:leader peptidase (prepilin peptidase)/N-methyltransferase